MRKKIALLIAFVLAATALTFAAPASNQAIDFNTLIANQSGNFTWISSAPSGSAKLITYADYKTYVANQTTTCTVPSLASNYVMTWADVIACASSHTASQQSEGISGNYSTIYYTAQYNSKLGNYACIGPNGSDTYTGTPIALPAGTVAPTSANPIRLYLSSITYPGSTTQLSVQLKNPSGSVVNTWTTTTSTLDTGNWTSGAAGAWSWVISQTGGTEGTCNSTSGASGGGTQVQWSGTAYWYQ